MSSDIRQGPLRQDTADQTAHLKCLRGRRPRARAGQGLACDRHPGILHDPVAPAAGARCSAAHCHPDSAPFFPPGTWRSNRTCATDWCLRTKRVNTSICAEDAQQCLSPINAGDCTPTRDIGTCWGHSLPLGPLFFVPPCQEDGPTWRSPLCSPPRGKESSEQQPGESADSPRAVPLHLLRGQGSLSPPRGM